MARDSLKYCLRGRERKKGRGREGERKEGRGREGRRRKEWEGKGRGRERKGKGGRECDLKYGSRGVRVVVVGSR